MFETNEIESVEFTMDLEDNTRDVLKIEREGVTYETNQDGEDVKGILRLPQDDIDEILQKIIDIGVPGWSESEYMSTDDYATWSVIITLTTGEELYKFGGGLQPDRFDEFVDFMDEIVGEVIEDGDVVED